MTDDGKAIAKTVGKLVAVVPVMFAFVLLVMPPMYDALCDALGIGGRTSGEAYQVTEYQIDEDRTIRVQFVVNKNEDMPWDFGADTGAVAVNPGRPQQVLYRARNPESQDMVGQAIPSVSPARAAPYFHKTECFCFQHQPLEAGGEAELPLQFIVDRDLPEDIKTITLSYTIFDITERDQRQSRSAAR